MNARRVAPLVLVALVAVACATITVTPYQAAVVTATKLDEKFLSIGQLYDSLYQAGKMPESDYQQWRQFASHYKAMSDIVYRSLRAARTDADIEAAVTTLNRLAMDLAVFLTYGNAKRGEGN